MKRIAFFVLLLAPLTRLDAQPVFEKEDMEPAIGDAQELIIEIALQSLSELGIQVGEPGGPQEFDFSQGLVDVMERGVFTLAIVSPADAPDGDQYPGADYAIRMEGITGIEDAVFIFMDETPTESRTLGVAGMEELNPVIQAISGAFEGGETSDSYPLTVGKKLEPMELPMEYNIEDVKISGTMVMEGEVDAWGTAILPAGRFEVLRQSIGMRATMKLETPDGETLEFVEEIDQYQWLASRIGLVALVQETRVIPVSGGDLPSTTVTQVMRLNSFRAGPTAVELATWAQVKAGFRK